MKILIAQIGRLGDMVLVTPMFRALHEQYPQAEIHVLASKKNADLLSDHPSVKKLFVFEKKPLKLLRLLSHLRREKYDYWIDPKDHYSSESAFLARRAGAGATIGFNRPGRSVFTIPIPSQEENHALHVVERNLQTLQALGIRHQILRPELFVGEESHRYVQAFLQNSKGSVLINLSAGQPYRVWPVEDWIELLSLSGVLPPCLVSFVPSEEASAKKLQAAVPSVRLFPSRSLHDTIALVQAVRLVLTPDTSIVHIAAAFDRPVIGLYPNIPSNFIKFRPLSTDAIVLMPQQENGGVSLITIQQMKQAIEEMMVRLSV